jgi:hypothetical protein
MFRFGVLLPIALSARRMRNLGHDIGSPSSRSPGSTTRGLLEVLIHSPSSPSWRASTRQARRCWLRLPSTRASPRRARSTPSRATATPPERLAAQNKADLELAKLEARWRGIVSERASLPAYG